MLGKITIGLASLDKLRSLTSSRVLQAEFTIRAKLLNPILVTGASRRQKSRLRFCLSEASSRLVQRETQSVLFVGSIESENTTGYASFKISLHYGIMTLTASKVS